MGFSESAGLACGLDGEEAAGVVVDEGPERGQEDGAAVDPCCCVPQVDVFRVEAVTAEYRLVFPRSLRLFIGRKIARTDVRGTLDQRAFSWLSGQRAQEFWMDSVECVVGFLFL